MKSLLFLIGVACWVSCNPFAPGLDTNIDPNSSVLGDPTTVEGVFQNIKYAYTFRDTSIYGELVNSDFIFLFRDYDRGADVTWGRDEEMRTTNALFRTVQRIDLLWTNIVSQSIDSSNTRLSVVRGFNLKVTLNPADIQQADGYANLALIRQTPVGPWQILRWRDESNF
jgi:hypothetical protein